MFRILFLFFTFLFIWPYCGYIPLLVLISKIKKNINKGEFYPKVSIIICTYNEGNVIERRIRNCFKLDYPKNKLEIIVVDSNSSDGTANKAKKFKNIKVIEEDMRKGKASAINLGLKTAKGEIIILTDAPTIYSKDTVKKIIKNFNDPSVGAATGKFIPIGGTNSAEVAEKTIWNLKDTIRRLESLADSTTWLSGELCCFRKSLIDQVDEDTLADDVNIAIKVRKRGYRVIFDPNVGFSEKIPANYEELKIQKVRRALGGIKENFRFKKLLFNPKYGIFGILIMPNRFLLLPLNPFIMIGIIITFGLVLYKINIIYSLFFLIFIIFFFSLKNKISKKSKIFKKINSLFIAQEIILRAFYKLITKKYSVNWKKIETTREEN